MNNNETIAKYVDTDVIVYGAPERMYTKTAVALTHSVNSLRFIRINLKSPI